MSAQARVDPLRTFRFKIYFGDATPVALVSKMSALKMSTEVVNWREGGDTNIQRNLPGKSKYEPVTFEQGLVVDNTAFDEWMETLNKLGTDNIGTESFRKDLKVEVEDIDGATSLTYELYSCWPTEYQALPDLDANGNAVGLRTLKVTCEGWKVS
ncbi:hypothetical protein DYY67_1363 [Candidatus Nitrosotalea sp. TS]|uniref:phage tail protein n=1 Tax=Candidatus Nitrosotalea sp. TS TaxID=2341020 RepID=UPI00140E4BCE|nr:phage tail protein [Candidatus Nitrosotalea sp. TS]NHI03568.1 hypothetical protein [Candidatus Nitrosotalea sp. TS]